jgi:hypothetical protein
VRILGIDPGAKGALALNHDGFVTLHEMPRLAVTRGSGSKDEVDGYALRELITWLEPEVAYIEQVGGMEGQSASASFNFGRAAAAAEYMLVALGIRHVRVTPVVWKREMKVKAAKDDARAIAMRRWPHLAKEFKQKRADYAEAALISEYGRLEQVKQGLVKEQSDVGLFD